MQPSWDMPLTIDYSLQDTNFYLAQLIDVQGDDQKVLAEVRFKLAELITSMGQYIYKELQLMETP